MIDLITFHAHICPVAGGFLIYKNKVLLVKHKKLKWWLAPGGHIEGTELPHQAAEREFFEETGIKVKAISPHQVIESSTAHYLPAPFASNLHWISQTNYDARTQSDDPSTPHRTQLWPRGCEQHFSMMYLVEPLTEAIIPQYDPNESDGIEWFGLNELDSLETTDDIRQEIRLAFDLNKDL